MTEPANPLGLPIATTSWPTRRCSASPSGAGDQIAAVGAQHRQVREPVEADDAEAELAPVDERGATAATGPRAGDDVRRGEQEPVGRQRDRAAGAGRAPGRPAPRRITRRFATTARAARRHRRPPASRRRAPRPRWPRIVPPWVTIVSACHGAQNVTVNCPLVGPADDRQLELARCARARRAPRTGRRRGRLAVPPAATIRSPRSIRRPRRRAVVLDAADQDAVALGQADGAAQSPRDPRRRDRDAEPDALGRLAAAERRRRARAELASAGIARISPPSTRTALIPSRRPLGSSSGPPEEPRGSGAVCSIAPAIRRPRGPRKLRAVEDTNPGVTRRPRPPGLPSASTARPIRTGARRPRASRPRLDLAGVDRRSRRCRDRSPSPATRPGAGGRPAKVTVVSSWRRLWAFVRTRPGAITDAGADAPAAAEADHRRPVALGGRLHGGFELFKHSHLLLLVTCNMQVSRLSADECPYDSPANGRAGFERRLEDDTSRSALADALATVGDRWTLLLVAALLDGPRRFGELQEEVARDRSERAHPAPARTRAQRARRRAPVLRASAAVRL